MLPQKRRINKAFFPEIIKKSRLFVSSELSIRVAKQDHISSPTLFSVVVSSKTIKTAVGRNRAKRRIREIVRKSADKVKDGYFVIFFINRPIEGLKLAELEQTIFDLLEKACLFKNL